MERRTAVQAACVFVATVAAGLPFALQTGQWMADRSGDSPAPAPAQTRFVDAGTGAAPGGSGEEQAWDEPRGEGGGIAPAPREHVAVLPSQSADPAAVAPRQGSSTEPAKPEPTTPAEEPTEPQQTEPPAEPEPTTPPEEPQDPPASNPPAPALTPID